MADFAPVDQIGASGDPVADLAGWIASPPLAALVATFGGDPTDLTAADVPLTERFAALDTFTDRWDTRLDPVTGQARERNQAHELPLSDDEHELALAAADAFGMRKVHTPRHADYDHVRSCSAA